MRGTQSSQESWLTRQAESIRRTFTICEETCLEVGTHLGDAVPGLMELSSAFEALSRSLDSDQLEVAMVDLFEASDKMESIGRALSYETSTFSSLITLDKTIGVRVASLIEYLRIINALVFNIKIEAVSLTGSVDNMTDFADNLRSLVHNAQAAFNEYQKTHLLLSNTLRSAFETQTSFQRSHQETLASVSDHIAEQLSTVDKRRHQVATALADLGTRSQHIGMQVSQSVFALQIGDSTRQRIEHVHDALELIAETIKGQKDPWDGEIETIEQKEAILASICLLQANQLEGAADDFSREMNDIDRLLLSLNEETVQLASLGRELFGSGSTANDSFLGSLESRLKTVLVITEQYRRARAGVDEAGEAIGEIVDDLNQRTKRLSSIISDMTILGMNAILKSGRAGTQGRGLNVIAQELRDYAMKVVQGIEELPVSLAQVINVVEQLNTNGRLHNAVQMAELAQRMEAAIASVGANGSDMSAALDRLEQEGTTIRKIITEAITKLGNHSDISRILEDTTAVIREKMQEIGDPAQTGQAGYEKIGQLLYAKYTMASERDIHKQFSGGVGIISSVVKASAPEEDELVAFTF